MNLNALANGLWWTANLPAASRFDRALRQPRRVQANLLCRYLRDHADTAFGRMHGFARIKTVAQFQAAVPIRRYDEYQPFVDRIVAGEARVLTSLPVRVLTPSSGSTAAVKLIPYTQLLQREFARAIGPWIVDLFRTNPRLAGGPAYWSISPVAGVHVARASAVPIGFEDDSAYLGRWGGRLIDAALAAPGALRLVSDIESFRYLTLLYLLRAGNLRMISVWHPSFLGLLIEPLAAYWPDLLRDLADGIARPPRPLPPELAPRLRLGRARRRVRELEHLGPNELSRLWPQLQLISCWADAHAAGYVPALHKLFPDITIQPKGLIATEGFISLPYRGRFPLAVASHFFEFLTTDGQARLADELEPGGEYRVVLTTGGGLYRYDLGDRVQVTGHLEATPCLRFLGKEDALSDLRGEKLSEGFVAKVLGELFATFKLAPAFSLLAPVSEAQDLPRYVLYLETDTTLPTGLAEELERRLRENPHYDYCARLGQLGPATVLRTGPRAYQAYVEQCRRFGQRPGNIKPSCLSRHTGWSDILR